MNNVFDVVSHLEREAALKEFRAALDRAVVVCDPNAQVFAKIDRSMQDSGIIILHSAVIKGSWTHAREIRSDYAGWRLLGEVAKPSCWIAERFSCELGSLWPRFSHAFVVNEWAAWVSTGSVDFEVSAPAPLWPFVQSCSNDITDQAVLDWEALAAEDGFVTFAHLQVLPIEPSEDFVEPSDTSELIV